MMVTIRDIAKAAGVSTSTASRALNNNPHISTATIQKVQKIAKQLGYRPDYNAKNLTNGEANAVGVVFPVSQNQTTGNPFYISLLAGINQELVKRQYALSVAIAKNNTTLLENVKSMVFQSKIKRFIILYSKNHDRVMTFLRQHKLRFVVIGQPPHTTDYYVDNNNVKAGATAATYLLTKHRLKAPLFVMSDQAWTYEQQRYQGFKQVLTESGYQPQCLQIKVAEAESIQRFIFEQPKIDGIVATDDELAMAFWVDFHKVYPKRQLPMVGFNRVVPALFETLNFNSVDLFPEAMGLKAVILLFSDREDAKIDGQKHLIVRHKIYEN